MKLSFAVFVVLATIAIAIIGYYGWQRVRLFRDVANARVSVGSRQGGATLVKLVTTHPENAELSYLYGRHLRMQGRTTEALDYLKRAGDLGWACDPLDRENLLVRAQTEAAKAEPALQNLLNQNPQDDEILLALSLGWSRALNLKKAEALVNSVLQRRPHDGLARCLHGRIMLQRGQPHLAFPDLDEACRVGADQYYYPDARLLLANCLLDLGRFEESLARFRECQVEEPDNIKVLLGEARCYWFLDRWDEAAAVFNSMLQIDPDHLDALSQLAYIHEERGNLAEACRLLERAAKADPTWADLSFRLAKVLNVLGETDQANESLARADKLKNHYAKPRSNPFTMKNAYTGEEAKSIRGSSGPLR